MRAVGRTLCLTVQRPDFPLQVLYVRSLPRPVIGNSPFRA
nr:MAG TPA: hypothetical protein [Caudoviricetes sp.]